MNDFKILICGGRHFDDYALLEAVMGEALKKYEIDYCDIEIVSGHCDGADKLGELFARNHSVPTKIFIPNWKAYGKAAGPIRNKEMIDYISSFPNALVIAFVSENTKGTRNTINLAKKKNIDVIETPYVK